MMRVLVAVLGGLLALAAAPSFAAGRVCDVRDHGARGDGKTIDTRAIQAAVDACSATGGTVYLGAGTYVSGTVRLKSHMTLKLDHGAVLTGSHNIADYWPSASIGLGRIYGTNTAGEGMLTGLLIADNVVDLTVEGPGIIDGQSDYYMSGTIHASLDYAPDAVRNPAGFAAAMHRPDYGPFEPLASGRPGVLFLIFHGKDVTLRNINLRDSPNWTLVLQDVERATISDFSIINNPLMPNNDGIDCMACRDVHIANGTIRTGDDDIVLVNGEDVTVSGVSMYSRSAAIRLESTQRAVLQNLTIEANRGLAIFASRQIQRPTDGVLFSDIVMRTRLMPGHWWGKGEPIYISAQPCGDTCGSAVRNVVFSNIETDAEAGIMIAGAAGVPVENVELRDVRLRMVAPDPALAAAVGGNFDRRWTAATPVLGIVKHDIPAIFCEATSGLTLRDVEIRWAADVPAYSRSAVACANSTGLVFQHLSEIGARRPGPALELQRSRVDRQTDVHLRK